MDESSVLADLPASDKQVNDLRDSFQDSFLHAATLSQVNHAHYTRVK